MSLLRALSAAQSGLGTSSLRAEVAANNIANANTPAYAVREVDVRATGNGVGVIAISRASDGGIAEARRSADGQSARSDILTTALRSLEQALGQPGDGIGLLDRIEDVQSSLENAVATPESDTALFTSVESLEQLARELQSLSEATNKLRTDADIALGQDVERANRAMNDIHSLNAQIVANNAADIVSADLIDRREILINDLAKILPIQVQQDDTGRVQVKTSDGAPLVGFAVHPIEFDAAGFIPAGARIDDTPSLLGTPQIGDHTLSLREGSLAGHLKVRDDIALTFSDEIDQLASELIVAFQNPAESTGLYIDGGGTGLPLRGLAGRITLNPTLSDAPNRLRDGLAATSSGPVGDTGRLSQWLDAVQTFPQRAATIANTLGSDLLRQDSVHAGNLSRQATLQEAELSRTGVDTDFELQSLLAIEQSYQANARVIQTVADMMDTLLRL